MTISLTESQRGKGQKQENVKPKKQQGVKTPLSGGVEPGSVAHQGKGGGARGNPIVPSGQK